MMVCSECKDCFLMVTVWEGIFLFVPQYFERANREEMDVTIS